MSLSPSKYRQILRALSGQQAKVFDCIPIEEVWNFKQINAEVTRRGMSIRWDQFQGCVNALKESGLVKEVAPGMFRREPVRRIEPEKAQPSTTESSSMSQNPSPIITKPAASSSSPTDRLGNIAARVRTMSDVAIQLHHEAVKVADEIDNVAIDLEEGTEENAKALQKLRTLQEALKGLG